MILATGEAESFNFSRAATTILTGPRNSSKTTTLKVIDYCFGGGGSVAGALGAAIDDKYVALVLTFTVDGEGHTLRRDFTFGQRGLILLDATLHMSPQDLSNWLLEALSWPRLSIPLGRNAATATQQMPLSFRSVLRHIYRRENSWTEFAAREEEFLRRAVISLLLGFAPQRYETAEFDLGRAQRELASAQAVQRDVLLSTEQAVGAIVRQLGLPLVYDADSLADVEQSLTTSLASLRAERDALFEAASRAATEAEAALGLDAALPARLQEASREAAEAAERASSLSMLLVEHQQGEFMVKADIARLTRLVDAVTLFDELPVRICPACEQDVDAHRGHAPETCYLCTQTVTEDVRQRRADRELRSLETELEDLAEAVARARSDYGEAQRDQAIFSAERAALAKQLHDARVTTLAPFMATLEDLARLIGRVEQQVAAIPALAQILERRVAAEAAVEAAEAEVARLTQLAEADARQGSDAARRCAVFADRMNGFLGEFRTQGWVEGQVTISADDLTFFVGTRPWADNLGAEARVLFFLAYSFALLHLDADLGRAANAPGVLMLDNPYQQGLPPLVVVKAIDLLANAADRLGVQLLLTQARPATDIRAPHFEVSMPTEYSTS